MHQVDRPGQGHPFDGPERDPSPAGLAEHAGRDERDPEPGLDEGQGDLVVAGLVGDVASRMAP